MKTLLAVLTLLAIAPAMAAHAEEPPTFLLKWGTPGVGDGEFGNAQAIASSNTGTVYVQDALLERVQKFSSTGQFLLKWSMDAIGLAVGPGGSVFATTGSGGITVNRYNEFGGLVDQFTITTGLVIAVDHTGQYLYACDGPGVTKYTITGTRVETWTTDNSFYTDNDGIAVGPGGDVYVADAWGDQIYRFTGDGAFILKWGHGGAGDGELSQPAGLAVDSHGDVYVADLGNSRVQKFSRDGVFLTKWGMYGSGEGEFKAPADVAIDGDDNVYVVDSGNSRVQKFGDVVTPTVPTTWGRIKTLYR